MKMMPNISLTRKQLRNLLKYNLYSCGSEGAICRPDTEDTIYKIFTKGKKVVPMTDNKEKKIRKLYELDLEDSTRPLSTISYKNELIGYEMTYDKDEQRFSPSKKTHEQKIEFLDETCRILRYFSTKEIVYGDVAYRNILYNIRTGKYRFCDMDNIQIGNLPIDLVGNNSELLTYEELRGIDQQADAYMHNFLTIKTLGLEICLGFDDELEDYFEHPAIEIFDSLQDPEEFNGEYAIQYIKRK